MYTLREIRIGKAAAVNNNRIRFSCPINNKDGTLIMFTLTTDTSIDVFRNKLDELGVYWVPLTYTIDGVVYEDNFSDDEHYKAFYDKIRAGALPVTSQINPYTHEEFWEKSSKKPGKTTSFISRCPAGSAKLIPPRAKPLRISWKNITT